MRLRWWAGLGGGCAIVGPVLFARGATGGVDLGSNPPLFQRAQAPSSRPGSALWVRGAGGGREQLGRNLVGLRDGSVILLATYVGPVDFGGGTLGAPEPATQVPRRRGVPVVRLRCAQGT